VVSSFIVQALLNKDITVFGGGDQTRSFCYIDDLVSGLVKMMGTPHEVVGPINLGNPDEFTICELAELVLDLTGSRSKIVNRPLPQDDPKKRKPVVEAAQQLLDWQPTTSLKEGLARTIPYFEQLLSAGDERMRRVR
jgi:UDP-glucuronate decarboxylase